MTTAATAGVGSAFKRSDMASAPTFATVAEVNSITGPTMTRSTIDVTSLDSSGGYREFITGFRDGGTVSLSMNFTPTGYGSLLSDFGSATLRDYQIVLSDTGATTFDFSALVTEIPLDIPTDDKITCTVTLKISGAVTMTS